MKANYYSSFIVFGLSLESIFAIYSYPVIKEGRD
jgi:hypothetical protein